MDTQAIIRRLIRFVLTMLIALILAGIVLYLAIYALQRSSMGDNSGTVLFALALVGGAIGLRVLFVVRLAGRFKRSVDTVTSGNKRNRVG